MYSYTSVKPASYQPKQIPFSFLKWLKAGTLFLLASTADAMSRSTTAASFHKFDATPLFDNTSTHFPLPQTTLTADLMTQQLPMTSYSYSLLSASKPEICTVSSSISYKTLQIDEPSALFAERDYYSIIGATETERSQLPSWVKLTATLDTIFPAYDIQKIAVQGNIVFLATKHAGLQIVDMTDTTNPRPTSSYPLDTGEGEDIALLDNIALFAAGTSGLHIINISDPARPTILNIVPPLNNSATMAVTATQHTALALNVHGLQVINIHKPRHPKIEQVLTPAGWDADTLLFVPDDDQIVLGGSQGLQMTRLHGLTAAATQWFKQPYTGRVRKLLTIDNTLMALTTTGLQVVSFDNNMTATTLHAYPYDDQFQSITSLAAAKLPGQAVLAVSYGRNGLQFLDMSDPLNLRRLGNVRPLFSPAQETGEIIDMVPFQTTLLAVTASKGLHLLHFKDPVLKTAPYASEPGVNAGQNTSVTLRYQRVGDECQTTTFQLKLDDRWSLSNAVLKDQSIFASEQTSFKLLLSSQRTFDNPNSDFLLFSLQWISRPQLPAWLDLAWRPVPVKKPTVGWTARMAGANGIVCLAKGEGGAEILDAFKTETLGTWQGTATDKVNAQDVAVSGDGRILFIADKQAGLRVVDISSPGTPRPLTNLPGSKSSYAQIKVTAHLAIALTDSVPQVIDIINISDPAVPVLQGNCSLAAGMTVADMVITDDQQQVLLASNRGLKVVNIIDPTSITVPEEQEDGPASVSAIAAAGDEVFFTDASGQLYYSHSKEDLPHATPVLQRGDPEITIKEEDTPTSDHTALQWLPDRRLLFAISRRHGLEIFDTEFPASLRLLGTYPAAMDPFFDVVVMGKTAFVANGDHVRLFSLDGWTLTATPRLTEDEGNYHLRLIATDAFNGVAEDTFTLRVEGKPRLMNPIPTQYARVGYKFDYPIPSATFYDPNLDVLNFTVEYDEGINWLKFNSRLGEFYSEYLVSRSSRENASITVTAIDPLGLSEHTTFNLKVIYPMSVTNPITPQPLVWVQGRYANFSMAIRQHFYIHEREVAYNVTSSKHQPLPSWLNFTVTGDDADKSLVMAGVPPVIEGTKPQALSLSISARDEEVGEEISTDLGIITQPNFPPQIRQPVAAQYVEVKQLMRLELAATDTFFDANNDTLTYSASLARGKSLPAWLQFHQQFNELIINGTPGWHDTALLSDGMLTVYLNASDPDNLTVSLPIDIHVTCRSTLLACLYQYITPGTILLQMLLKLFGSLLDRCNYASAKQPPRTLQPGKPLSFETAYQSAVNSVIVKSPVARPVELDCFYGFNRPKAMLLALSFKLPGCMQPFMRCLAQQLPATSYVLLPYEDIAYSQDWVKHRYEFGKNVVQFNGYVPPGIEQYRQLLLVVKGPWIWLKLPPAWRCVPGLGLLVDKINTMSKTFGIEVIKEHCFLRVASYVPPARALTDHFDDDAEQASQQDNLPLLSQARHRQRYQAIELTDFSVAEEEKAEEEVADRSTGRTGNCCFAIVRACWARQRFFQPATLPQPQEHHIEMQARRAASIVTL